MDGQSRQSSPVKDAQRPGRRAASDFPSLLTVRSSAQNARSDSKTLPLFRSWPSDSAFSQVTLWKKKRSWRWISRDSSGACCIAQGRNSTSLFVAFAQLASVRSKTFTSRLPMLLRKVQSTARFRPLCFYSGRVDYVDSHSPKNLDGERTVFAFCCWTGRLQSGRRKASSVSRCSFLVIKCIHAFWRYVTVSRFLLVEYVEFTWMETLESLGCRKLACTPTRSLTRTTYAAWILAAIEHLVHLFTVGFCELGRWRKVVFLLRYVFDAISSSCKGSPQEAKAERGCSASSCYVSWAG